MLRGILALLVAGCAMAAPFALDIYRDRQHRMVIRGPVTVYHSATPQWLDPGNAVVATVSENNAVRVRRIRYEKDYVAVRVQLDRGLEGHVFAGDDFELVPAAW